MNYEIKCKKLNDRIIFHTFTFKRIYLKRGLNVMVLVAMVLVAMVLVGIFGGVFLGAGMSIFNLNVKAQENQIEGAQGAVSVSGAVSKVNGSIDSLIKAARSVLDKLTFIKAIWGKVMGVYGRIKAFLVEVWDKYLNRYLGKYVEIIKENIRQGIEEEREELKQLMTNN